MKKLLLMTILILGCASINKQHQEIKHDYEVKSFTPLDSKGENCVFCLYKQNEPDSIFKLNAPCDIWEVGDKIKCNNINTK